MKLRHCIIALALCGFALPLRAQLSLPTKVIDNTQYYYYKVKKKETLYGISTQYGISQEMITKYNPSVKDGLKVDQMLYFPVSAFSKTKSATATTQKSTTKQITKLTHVVNKGETLYGISKMYNVSIEDIIKANPTAEGGLKVNDVITIPQDDSINFSDAKKSDFSKPAASPSKIIFHKIKAGETLYSVARSYNTTVQSILDKNPGLSQSNFKYDEIIRVQPNMAKPVSVEKQVTEFFTHEVKKGETFYSIANNYGISVDKLQEVNPDIKKLKKGSVLTIPKTRTETYLVNQNEVESTQKTETNYTRKVKYGDTINVAIMLPFMLKTERPSAQALNNTEFYKGFMLAVDSVRKKTKKHINIYAYDNNNSMHVTDSLLSLPAMKRMNLIMAPSNSQQLAATNKFCKDNNILCMNAFSVKDEAYNTNSCAFQGNIPPSYLTAELLDSYDKDFSKYTMVFLQKNGSETKDFYDELKKHLTATKDPFITISTNNEFSYNELNNALNPGSKYVVMLSTSSKDFLSKTLPILKKIKQDRIDIDLIFLGYPEYLTYLVEFKSDLHKVDTYVYSRFFYDGDDRRTKEVEEKYKRWYGENMRYTAPRMGLLGFDTGQFFLQMLCKGSDTFNNRTLTPYKGVQNSFKFERTSNWSGFINKSIQFIHFTPFDTIEK